MERINNGLEKTLRTYLFAANRLLLLNNEAVDKNNIQIKSLLDRLLPPFNDLGEQLLECFLQTLPDVILVDVEFRRKITFNDETLVDIKYGSRAIPLKRLADPKPTPQKANF